MLADGRTVNRIDYPALADTLGISAGETTFQIPDLRGKFLYGASAPGFDPTPRGAATVRSPPLRCRRTTTRPLRIPTPGTATARRTTSTPTTTMPLRRAAEQAGTRRRVYLSYNKLDGNHAGGATASVAGLGAN